MIVAVSTNDRFSVEGHFGHCKEFALFNCEDAKVTGVQYVAAPPHEPGVIPAFVAEQGAQVIIAGNMGARAMGLFNEKHIQVVLGAQGGLQETVEAFMAGTLISTGSTCSHDHEAEHSC